MNLHGRRTALLLVLACASQAPAQDRRFDDGGDLDKIAWQRPYAQAREEAARLGRVMLVKPIMGGSNTPNPKGVPCGGKNDCEGSW